MNGSVQYYKCSNSIFTVLKTGKSVIARCSICKGIIGVGIRPIKKDKY